MEVLLSLCIDYVPDYIKISYSGIRKFALWAQTQGLDPAQLDQEMLFGYLTHLDPENASVSTIEKVGISTSIMYFIWLLNFTMYKVQVTNLIIPVENLFEVENMAVNS